MVTGNGQLRHALRERSAAAARFPHAYGGLLPARPGTPGIYFEYSRKLVTLVGLVCCFLGASGAEEYFFVRAGGPGRPLGAEWPLKRKITRPAVFLPIKGGHVRSRLKRIIITSPLEPKQWYPELAQGDRFDQLHRRITHVERCTKRD